MSENETKMLRHYLTRDPEEDAEGEETGYVVACCKEHAEENAGDLDMVLTGNHRPHDDVRDECALCGWVDEDCTECNEEAAYLDISYGGQVAPRGRVREQGQHRG